MLAPPDVKIFEELVARSNREGLAWMAGFLAARLGQPTGTEATTTAPPPAANRKMTLLYGSETGNAKRLATKFAATAKKQGIGVKLAGLDQYKFPELEKEEYLFAVVSTQGDGEPPASAKKFYEQMGAETLSLPKLKYGVLGLGDTSYPLFCQAAEDMDIRLNKLGGERLIDLQKCDTDYEVEAGEWFLKVAKILATPTPSVAPVPTVPLTPTTPKPTTHKKLYSGTVTTNINLNDTGSAKQTHHIVLSTEAATDYAPGDAIGFVPHNSPAVVKAILNLTGLDRQKRIRYKDAESSAETLLAQRLNVVYLPERVVSKYAAIVGQEIPAVRMDLSDLLRIYPVKDAAQFEEVVKILDPIAPRLYSISSSPAAHPEEIHITVSNCGFAAGEEQKWGLCSDYLAGQPVGSDLHFYIHHNAQFKLPPPDSDIIMVGPGTGIAPFRSFLAERDATGANGRNWLFFGEQYFTTDFLYQTEVQRYAETGVLTHVNVAFSRDQKEKLYVQHRMQQQAETLWEWLNNGAYFYVCGAREPMSIDVETMLLTIIGQQGSLSPEAAAAWLNELEETGRYLKDVY